MPRPMHPDENVTQNVVIAQTDDICVQRGEPPLSVLVVHKDGSTCSVFFNTVERYRLRREGETDAQLVARYRDAAYKAHGSEVKARAQAIARNRVVVPAPSRTRH